MLKWKMIVSFSFGIHVGVHNIICFEHDIIVHGNPVIYLSQLVSVPRRFCGHITIIWVIPVNTCKCGPPDPGITFDFPLDN